MLQFMVVLDILGCLLFAYIFILFTQRRSKLGKDRYRIGSFFHPWILLPIYCLLGFYLAVVTMMNYALEKETLFLPAINIITDKLSIAFFMMGIFIFSYLAIRRIVLYEQGIAAPFRVMRWDAILEYQWSPINGKQKHAWLSLRFANYFLGRKWLHRVKYRIAAADRERVDGFLKDHLPGKLK
jgi:hypothetical protein